MSKVLGIVAEYNPFHNGHLYHLNESKKLTNSDFTIAIMSGNFVQRGEPAIVDKWTRAKMAIENGVDLVIELPVKYAISSAENFAFGATEILNSLNIVDNISFGTETGNLSFLQEIANILVEEPIEYKKLLSKELSTGISFPRARERALYLYLDKDLSDITGSNNILAIEYLKSLNKLNSKITPVTLERNSVHYNSNEIINNIASATGIRKLIKENNFEQLKSVVPKNIYEYLINSELVFFDDFEKEIIYTLRKLTKENIANLVDVSEGLENRIKESASVTNKLSELISIIKTKRYTETRINRILLYALLGITKGHINYAPTTHIHILGANENGKNLLSKINPNLQIITSAKGFEDILEKEILATNIYTLAYTNNSKANLDYTIFPF